MKAPFSFNDDSVVVVIGSGAGGGALSRQLTRQGINVVCLEAGPRLNLGDIVNDDATMFGRLSWLDRRIGEGNTVAGLPVWSCKTAGGTTTHWTANCPRFREFELKAKTTYGALPDTNLTDWPISPEELNPYYDMAEDMLGVTGTNGIPRLPGSNNFKVMEAGGRNIGYTDIDTYNMAINSQPRDGRSACLQSGFCSAGCAINAKWTTLFTHIPEAEKTGNFELRSNCMATEIVTDKNGRASAVRYLEEGGRLREQQARVVCVAANVVETTRLLLNSKTARFPNGLANSSDQVGRNYMRHVTVQMYAVMPGVVNMYKGAQCAGVIRDEIKHDPSRGFSGGFQFHTLSLSPETMVNLLDANGWGEDYTHILEQYQNMAGMIITGEDPPQAENRITLHPTEKDQHGLPVPIVTYRNHPNTNAMIEYSSKMGRKLYESLGAMQVLSIEKMPATHNLGTARLGNDPETSVCNAWGQTHDVANLFVSDGSLFPTSGSANPTLTIISLMLRQGDYLAGQMKKGYI